MVFDIMHFKVKVDYMSKRCAALLKQGSPSGPGAS